MKPIQEYDGDGNLTHRRDSNGFERWWEYQDGNLTHIRDSNGHEWTRKEAVKHGGDE